MQILGRGIPVLPEEGEEDYKKQHTKHTAVCLHQGDNTVGHSGYNQQKDCHDG